MIKDGNFEEFVENARGANSIDMLIFAETLESMLGKPCILCNRPSACVMDVHFSEEVSADFGIPHEPGATYIFGLCRECADHSKSPEGEQEIENQLRRNIHLNLIDRI